MDLPKSFNLHPKVQNLWFWQSLIVCALISLPGLLGGVISGYWQISVVSLLVASLVFLLSRRYVRRFGQSFRCVLEADGLMVARGVWWHSEILIPRTRIQHTDVQQGPIARHYGMATLKIFTAGTHVSETEVEGLVHADALALRDQLLGRDADIGPGGRDGI